MDDYKKRYETINDAKTELKCMGYFVTVILIGLLIIAIL